MQKGTLGPLLVVDVHRADIGLEGYLVVDNTDRGPGKGGVRMHPDVNRDEVAELARAMSLKNALARLPFGGAKAGIVYNETDDKQKLFTAFFEEIKHLMPHQYISAPDIMTGEEEMGWLVDITGDPVTTTGKPLHRGGMEHKSSSTGYGVVVATEAAAEYRRVSLRGATIAIDGYGVVGSWAAKFLQKKGARIVAASGRNGVIYAAEGLDLSKLDSLKADGHPVTSYSGGRHISHDDMLALDTDILITASVSNVINEDNYDHVKTPLIVEGSNLPIPHDIEQRLHEHGVMIIPDIVANAGGVIASSVEHKGVDLSRENTFHQIETTVQEMTNRVLETSDQKNEYPQNAALDLAYERLQGTYAHV